jgi:hypothetical protein
MSGLWRKGRRRKSLVEGGSASLAFTAVPDRIDELIARLGAWERRHRFPRPLGFAELLALAVFVLYMPVFEGGTFVLRDFDLFGHPLAHHVKRSLLAGEIPLWNPLNDCGLPFLAQWNTMVCYPPAWLNLLLPLSWSVGALALLHLYLGGLGMYALALRWTRHTWGAAFAGATYAFSGIMQNSLMWPNNIAALGLLPWVLLAVFNAWRNGGRCVVAAALVGALQMLSGAPEIILFTWILAALALAADLVKSAGVIRQTARFIAVVLGTAGLAAIQLAPFLDLLAHSPRATGDVDMDWAIGRSSWAAFFIPLFENTGPQASGVYFQQSQSWTHSFYCGLAPWLLFLVAVVRNRSWRTRMLAVLVPFAILLAMGKDGGLYPVMDLLLPLGAMRFPVKFLMLVMVALPLLGAVALRRLPGQRQRGVPTASVMAGAALFVIALWLSGEREMAEPARQAAAGSAKGRLLILVAAGVLLVRFAAVKRSTRRWALPGLLLLSVIDLATQQPMLAPTVPRAVYDEPNAALPFLGGARMGVGRAVPSDGAQDYFLFGPSKPLAGHHREKRQGLFSNLNLPDEVAKVNGFYSLWLPRFGDVQHLLYQGPYELNAGFADFLGVRHVNSSRSPTEWLTRPTARPLVTAGQAPRVMSFAEIQATLPTPAFDPARVVLLEKDVGLEANPVAAAAVTNLQWNPHRITFEVRSPAATLATIAQSHYHWWRATVDGEPAAIHLANGAFQAVVVPAGSSEVVLEYVDRSFRIGAMVSALSVLLAGLLWWRLRW